MGFSNWIKSLFCGNQEFSEDNKPTKIVFSKEDYTKPNAFVHTWSLLNFAHKYGPKMEISKSPDFNNRESFWRCRFTDKEGKQTYVRVSSSMGETSVSFIKENKTKLRVGQLPNGKFVLYDNNFKDWVDVNLGI